MIKKWITAKKTRDDLRFLGIAITVCFCVGLLPHIISYIPSATHNFDMSQPHIFVGLTLVQGMLYCSLVCAVLMILAVVVGIIILIGAITVIIFRNVREACMVSDPVCNCELYKDESCSHVDGMLCDYPKCSMNKEYKEKKDEEH
jgi:hypothetical protein